MPFHSFWQAGYEGADHITTQGVALAMNEATGHLTRAAEDYAVLAAYAMKTVRESVGWRLSERNGNPDFQGIEARMRAAKAHDIQICWTLLHYGWPTDLTLLDPAFVPRFADFCGRVARFLAPWYDEAPVYSPINEISFTSWALGVGYFPSGEALDENAGERFKRQLVRAALAGCDAIRDADPRARFLHCDPIIYVGSGDDAPSREQAAGEHAAQYDAWDMIAGRRAPELGGAGHYLDLIGANYYHDNQWQAPDRQRLPWHLGDARRQPLHRMLDELYQRYRRPLLLAETSHVGSGRGAWIAEVAAGVAQAQLDGTDIVGVCLYPILDRPDWDNGSLWHHSGLWEPGHDGPDPLARRLCVPYSLALRGAQHSLSLFHSRRHSCHTGKEHSMTTLIVFSHLRWDFVYQRPQHLLSRLARYWQVLFIEEPVFEAGPAGLRYATPAPGVTVITPHTAVPAPGFHDEQIAGLLPLLTALNAEHEAPLVWFYTPMALPLLAAFRPALVVYDCMDELASFKNAPRQLLQRESALMSRADLLFTGGPSLHAAKQGRHDNAWCFPSSVDAAHFEQALDRTNGHPLQNALPHPRLGYYGVIDERMDLGLIAALADAHPSWQIVMVGPVVKIDPASLPQRENIHYFGQQPYQALPQFLAGWDVCLMPFALNASTRYISPTKVLEYMAAALPVVSTAITDVKIPYAGLVAIGHTPAEFIAGCEAALAATADDRSHQAQRMRAVVDATSWDATAAAMQSLIARAMSEGEPDSAGTDLASEQARRRLQSANKEEAEFTPCLILGAGPTGLSAAFHYGEEATLLERNAEVGGWCRSIESDGFTFDYAGHIMFSADPYVLDMYQLLLKDNLHWQDREAWIYSQRVYTRYPFQSALYGLPAPVIKECILGAVDARFGSAAAPLQNGSGAGGRKPEDCCADGVAPPDGDCVLTARDKSAANFETFIYQTWGAGIARHFAIPYNRKLWKVPLAEMETSWLGGRVPLPDLGQIIEGALSPVEKPIGPNARFGYPLRGGFQALMSGFLPLLKGPLVTGAEVVAIHPHEHIALLADGRSYRYEQMISTLPLPVLLRMVGDDVPPEIAAAANGLRHTSVRCVNLGIGREAVTEKHWIYYPEETIFHRIFVQGNASPFCSPPGGCGLTCEISYSDKMPLPVEGQALIDRCIAECIMVGIINADDVILTASQADIPYAYVIYDHAREHNVALARAWLQQFDITLAGRYSEWEYYNSDHAFLAGKHAAEKVTAGRRLHVTGA